MEEEREDKLLEEQLEEQSFTLQKHLHQCFCCKLHYWCVDNKEICKLLDPSELVCIVCDNLREGIDF